MKVFFILTLVAISSTACFTAKLLNNKQKPSYIANDSYSFSRAYYSGDSLLHIYLLNDNSKRPKTRYYTIALNVNAILKLYYRQGGGDVYFSHRIARQYRAISACEMIKSCRCVEAMHYGNTVLIDFKDTRVGYLRSLPPVSSAALIKTAGLVATDCCWQPQTNSNNNDDDGDEDNTPPIDNVTPIYVMPVGLASPLDSVQNFVALRMRLKNRRTKIALVPLTLMLDVVTSPIQLGVLWLNSKANDDGSASNNAKTAGNAKHIQPPAKIKAEKHRK